MLFLSNLGKVLRNLGKVGGKRKVDHLVGIVSRRKMLKILVIMKMNLQWKY